MVRRRNISFITSNVRKACGIKFQGDLFAD